MSHYSIDDVCRKHGLVLEQQTLVFAALHRMRKEEFVKLLELRNVAVESYEDVQLPPRRTDDSGMPFHLQQRPQRFHFQTISVAEPSRSWCFVSTCLLSLIILLM